MSILTESRHTEEFLLTEGNGTISREKATVDNGSDLVSGQVVKLVGGKLLAAAGTLDSSLNSTENIVGIISAAQLAASVEIPNQVYIARFAEVKDELVTYHTGSADANKKAAVIVKLKALGIIPR